MQLSWQKEIKECSSLFEIEEKCCILLQDLDVILPVYFIKVLGQGHPVWIYTEKIALRCYLWLYQHSPVCWDAMCVVDFSWECVDFGCCYRYPIHAWALFMMKVASASLLLLKITNEWYVDSHNISRRVEGWILMNIFSLNIHTDLLLLAIYTKMHN